MRMIKLRVGVVAVALLLSAVLLFAVSTPKLRQARPPKPMTAIVPPRDDAAVQMNAAVPMENTQTLFPDLNSQSIVSISVRTQSRSFEFHCQDENAVRVNGALADAEIFCTLLSQIQELPVRAMNAAFPQDAPLLTLVVSTQDAQHTARFYDDGGTKRAVHIVYGTTDTVAHRQTEAWRIGTLIMACEGARILDESESTLSQSAVSGQHDGAR